MSEHEYIGKYRIEERLGSGTFATVFRCYDPDLDTICAIKVLSENWSEDESARNWFLNEARVMVGIEHPSILRIFTSGELGDGRPYFVMEYADQGSLARHIRDRRASGETFNIHEAVEISISIADGLIVAHGRGLVHRDLKPSNILFRTPPDIAEPVGSARDIAPQIKLADFGLARRLEQGANSLAGAGTPHYIAPEQASGLADERPDVRNDIYSAATILYELLAGQVPFPYQSMTQVIAAHLNEEPAPIQERAPGVPDEVAALIHNGLAKEPDERVPTATAWKHQLQVLRTALNPDGTISGWAAAGVAAAAPGIANSPDEPEDTNPAAQTIPIETLAETKVRQESTMAATAAPDDEDSDDVEEEEPGRSNPMVGYVVAAVAIGLLVVGMLGFALADLVTDSGNGGADDETELSAGVGDDDGEVIPVPSPTPEGTDESGARVESTPESEPTATPSPEPEPSPTPTVEPTPEAEDDPAAEDVARFLEDLPGSPSSMIVLPSGDSVEDDGDRQVPAASTIALWVAAAAFDAAADGEFDLDEEYTISEADQTFGTGILNQSQYVGSSLTYEEIVETMLLYSDNTATNIIVDQIGGMSQVTEYASDHGYNSTEMNRMLGDIESDEENYSSGSDGALFMTRLLNGEVVDEDASERMRSILEERAEGDTVDLDFFGQDLPGDVTYAYISGLLSGTRNAIGYVEVAEQDGFVVISVMLGDLSDDSAGEVAIASAVAEIHLLLRESD